MEKKNTYHNIKELRSGDFYISSTLDVYHKNKYIGRVDIAENPDPNGENELVCFSPQGYEIANSSAKNTDELFSKLMTLK